MSRFRLFLSGLCLSGLSFTAPASLKVVDYIVAVVNEDVIMSSELSQTVDQIKDQLRERGSLPSSEVLRRQVLERLIVTRIQVQRARQGGLSVEDARLNAAMADIAARNGMNLNQFAQALRREGIDYLQLREQVREDMLVEQLRQREVNSRIAVSDEDVALLLERQESAADDVEYRLSHILISLPADADGDAREAAREEAAAIVAKARAGEEFSQLAITHSDSPRALEGGDLGWRRGSELPTLFADSVPQMRPGDVTDPIAASGGLHIVRLDERRGSERSAMVRETHARHILLKPNVLRDALQTREEAEALREELEQGADFAALAREHSEDPGSANQGGDLGWQGPEAYQPEFQQALDLLEAGETSPVFETPFGWHIAQVIERRERDRTEELKRAQARSAIFRRKASEEYESWVRQLRDEAYVEFREAPDAG